MEISVPETVTVVESAFARFFQVYANAQKNDWSLKERIRFWQACALAFPATNGPVAAQRPSGATKELAIVASV